MIRCVFYLRLSREDGTGESNSIQNQRMLLQRYLEDREDMTYVGEWVDDGWSGSNYERPAFREMMQAAAAGEFECILCKDLSRLGREYIQTGYFLREIFPQMGLRFIAVADHYDSASSDFMEDSLLLPVMNLMNDAYCRDISNKVRWQQRTKRAIGEYIGAFACYGYKKSDKDIHRLEQDEPAAEIVKIIYWLRLSGMAAENISGVLNNGQIKSPYQYKQASGSRYRSGFAVSAEIRNIEKHSSDSFEIEKNKSDSSGIEREKLWTPQTVRRILSNEMYTGVMIQGKNRKISYKLDKRIPLPEEQWTKVENILPVIIPKWVYDVVESLHVCRVRCRKGHVFCDELAGYGLTRGQQSICAEIVEMVLQNEVAEWEERIRGTKYDNPGKERNVLEIKGGDNGAKSANAVWQRRLLNVLLVKEIRLERKAIYIIYRSRKAGGEFSGDHDRYLCQTVGGAWQRKGSEYRATDPFG